jgi:hypothetical protein
LIWFFKFPFHTIVSYFFQFLLYFWLIVLIFVTDMNIAFNFLLTLLIVIDSSLTFMLSIHHYWYAMNLFVFIFIRFDFEAIAIFVSIFARSFIVFSLFSTSICSIRRSLMCFYLIYYFRLVQEISTFFHSLKSSISTLYQIAPSLYFDYSPHWSLALL